MLYKQRHRLPLAVLVLPLLLASTRASAEDSATPGSGDEMLDLSLEALLRMRVTSATGGLELESDVVPANVITISRADIVAHGWRSVAEVLEHVPGLYVVDDHVMPALSVRGVSGGLRSGARLVKVMINGVEVSFRPDLTAMLGSEYIPFMAVERIEIARGPLSALYGANAFLATVNVITREAAPTTGEIAVRGGLATSTDATAPSHPSGGVSALGATSSPRFHLLLAASYDRIDRSGLRIAQTFPSQAAATYQPFLAGRSDHDLSRPLGVFAQAGTKSRFGNFSLQGGLQRLDAYGEFQAESILTHQSRYGITNVWAKAKHELHWSDAWTSTLALGHSRGAPIADEALTLGSNDNSRYQTQLAYRAVDFKATLLWKGGPALRNLQTLASLDGQHEEHDGFNYRQTFIKAQPPRQIGDQVESRPSTSATLSNLAPSLQLLLAPMRDLYLIANGRLDLSSEFARQYSWRAGASYRFTQALVAKLITGHAFQSPSPVLLYGLPGFGVANSIVGSKSPGGEPLEPQTVDSAELVISALPSRHASIVASVFWQKVGQKIEFLSNAAGYRARNRQAETALGGELTLRGSFGRFAPHVSATTHRVLSAATASQASLDAGAPPHYPSYWVLLGLRVGIPELRMTLDATGRRIGPRGASQSNAFLNGRAYSLPAYNLFDLVATSDPLSLLGPGSATRFLLSVRNLLHAPHADPGFGGIDVPSTGRSVLLEIQQAF